MITIGIDPGITGAVSVFKDGELQSVTDLPMIEVAVGKRKRKQLVPGALADTLDAAAQKHDSHAYLEQVSSRPGEGAVGAFSFGRGFGQIEGILAALQIPYTLVPPAQWKRIMNVGSDKGLARLRAIREFPEHAGQFIRVKDDGRAEACLLGLYGVRQ